MKLNEYPEFHFEWQWIKDKVIEIEGDKWAGMLTIWDEDGYSVAIYAYELSTNVNE